MKRALICDSLSRGSLLAVFAALALLGGACGGGSSDSTTDGGGSGGGDNARFNFESDVQGWTSPDGTFTNFTASAAQKANGAKSLSATATTTADSSIPYTMEIAFMGTLPTIMPDSTATFHVYIPADSGFMAFQPYLNEGDASTPPYRFTSVWTTAMPGTWQTVEVTAPSDVAPLIKVGVQFFANADWTGDVYVDSVDWK